MTSVCMNSTLYDEELYNSAIHDIVVKADHDSMAMYATLTDPQKIAANKHAHDLYCTTMFIA